MLNKHWPKQKDILVDLGLDAISGLKEKPIFIVRRRNPTHAVVLVREDEAGVGGFDALKTGIEFFRTEERGSGKEKHATLAHMHVEYALICKEDFRCQWGEGFNAQRVRDKMRRLEIVNRRIAAKENTKSIQLPTKEEA